MSKAKAILTGLLATVYNMATEEIAELLDKSDEELDDKEVLGAIKNRDKARVTEIRTKNFDDGFKKAEKQSKSGIEKLFKDKFELNSDKQGQDLVDEIFELAGKSAEGDDPKKITDDDVKRHPVFMNMEKSFKQKLAEQQTEFDTKLQTKDKEYQRKDILGKVGKSGLAILEKLKPVLSKDPEVAANQRSLLLKEFENFDYEENESAPGGYLVYKDGQLFKDEHDNRVDFDKLASKLAKKWYDFEVAEQRDSANSKNQQSSQQNNSQQQHSYSGPLPKTKEEYVKMVNDSSLPLNDRIAIRDASPPEFQD